MFNLLIPSLPFMVHVTDVGAYGNSTCGAMRAPSQQHHSMPRCVHLDSVAGSRSSRTVLCSFRAAHVFVFIWTLSQAQEALAQLCVLFVRRMCLLPMRV
jgi:hypothetical protein